MTNTTFNVGDKVQTVKTIQTLNGSGLTVYQIGTQGTVIKVHTGKLVSVTIELENGKKLTATDKDFEMVIEPVASEPTAEAAQPAHRFPVGAVVVFTSLDKRDFRVTVSEIAVGYILSYLVDFPNTSYSLWVAENRLSAL